ncbi:hypothetical protein GH5_05730 [Leishmania sp. Ghana 2012 LV757]|uniref:hypothetical protein n=1 Tax=Leishmania sp. Ghana 2012 LV757 TaxID=2803181 RepID=UPI001B752AF4|nr:hypothetical protein GH5_05730 [Leishmania sp. Ghana 2012 LV757]
MKAILQVGPARFFVEGATFHLLCNDIQQALAALVLLQECSISLTLHVGHLETSLVEGVHRLNAAGVALPKSLPGIDDDSFAENSPPIRSVTASRSPRQRRTHVCPSIGQRQPAVHKGTFFIFSAASFDTAEAMVQRLHARLLEQRLLLDDIELQALCDGGNGRSTSDTSARVLPLPIVELDTYLSTSANVMTEYGAEGHPWRCSTTVVGVSATGRY